MQIKTEAIVIHAIRYGEADLIVKMFTKDFGIVSFMVKRVLKSKKGKLRASFFQLGSILEIDTVFKNKKGLDLLKEVKPIYHFNSLHTIIVKSSIVTFLLEILNNVLIEEQPDKELYQFICDSLVYLDQNQEITLYHMVFLLELTSFLGCYPDTSNSGAEEFDLETASYISYSKNKDLLTGELLANFNLLLGTKFDELKKISIAKTQRKELLNSILKYYQFHVPGYREPKSLIVLEQLFS